MWKFTSYASVIIFPSQFLAKKTPQKTKNFLQYLIFKMMTYKEIFN